MSYELVVVLDGSPDSTRNVVREFEHSHPKLMRVFSYDDVSGTASRGRNRGIVESRGEFVAFSDSDDWSHPDRLVESLAFAREVGADMMCTRARYVLDGTRVLPIPEFSETSQIDLSLPVLRKVNPVVMSSAMVRRDVFLEHGGFRAGLRYREDHELWLRLAHRGCRMQMLDRVLVDYLIHGGNNELNFAGEDDFWAAEMLRVYSQSFRAFEWGC
jgi:glycosyltransferase involved in cell wall biosynthesis